MMYPIAYIGPGAGFAFLGSFLTIAVAFLLSAVSVLLWPFRMAWSFLTGIGVRKRARVRKLIFLGLDGLDPRLVEKFMGEGQLPNFARLIEQGGFRRLRTTFPALSPVAWSTFATGVSPARHNIFDFLNRDLRSYLPELSSCRVRGPRRFWKVGRYRIPLERASAELRRKSQPFWQILGRQHVPCTILRVPITFPPEKFHGRLLSAMCTPDLKGTQGSFSRFTTREEGAVYTGGSVYPLQRAGRDLHGSLEGPDNVFTEEGGALRIPFRVTPAENGGPSILRLRARHMTSSPANTARGFRWSSAAPWESRRAASRDSSLPKTGRTSPCT